jgi:NADH-quinone oxidoreductase subunit C
MKHDLSFFFNNRISILFVEHLYKIMPAFIIKTELNNNAILITVSVQSIQSLLMILKQHFNVNYLIDYTGLDKINFNARFVLTCFSRLLLNQSKFKSNSCFSHLTKNYFNVNLEIVVYEAQSVPSISDTFFSANWLEREVYDFFGVYFTNHSDLRRIFSDYGFQGYPFRKDFPLSGYFEVRYDSSTQRVVLEPLELTQAFRYFDFTSPWVNLASSN